MTGGDEKKEGGGVKKGEKGECEKERRREKGKKRNCSRWRLRRLGKDEDEE